MKTLLNPLFIIAVVLAGANQLAERLGIHIPVIHSYLDDILCLPIVLTVGLAAYRIIIPNYTLSRWHIWSLVVMLTVIFEVYLPTTSNLYTADFLDPVAYSIGALLFSRFINK